MIETAVAPRFERRHSIPVIVLGFVLMLMAALLADVTEVQAQTLDLIPPAGKTNASGVVMPGPTKPEQQILDRGSNDISKMWRDIRSGARGKMSSPTLGTPVLVQSKGEIWRNVRNKILKPYGGYVLGAASAIVVLFWLIRGRIHLKTGLTGRLVARFSLSERMVHWYVAVIFLFMALSGLLLLFGRTVLIPVLGKQAMAILAAAALHGHNLFGPLFALGILAMFFIYVKSNLPAWADVKWIAGGGGMLRRGHASSWKFNAGEKIWFWLVIITGVAISTSGLLLDFSFIADNLLQIQIAHIVHVTGALIAIAGAIGHIYLGTIGVDGALQAMTSGKVDEAWAHEHHDLWAKQVAGEKSEETAQAPGAR